MSVLSFISAMLTYGIFIYSVVLLVSYILIGILAVPETRKYLNGNMFTDYRMLAASPHAPSISILAPAYNEGATIIENVRSLLSIYYNNLEVIIINDGSKDDTLAKLVNAYNLEKIEFLVEYKVATKNVRGIYKSTNPVYNKLIVVDKENGGKADALNVGVNIASRDYIVCIDVDCILEQDAILKMVKPFVEETGKRVIASGGVVRIANSCVIEDGKLVKVNLPDNYLARMQALEYIRAFLLGRMAWSRINGLLLISGAFGAFDKEIVIKCGGYNHNTVGEDMELVVRMRRYMEENKLPYAVTYIPDPLCWTEAPVSYLILGRQRNRWTRGTIETMWMHRKMFLNPRYGVLGLLSFPYWVLYEMLAPLIEFFGMIALIVMACFGLIAWKMFLLLLLFIVLFGYVYSGFAIYMEVSTYNQYRRKKEIVKLALTAMSEPFVFHPFVVWSAVKGYVDLIKKKKSWGEMTRQGFATPATPATPALAAEAVVPKPAETHPVAQPATAIQAPEILVQQKPALGTKLESALRNFASWTITLCTGLLLLRMFELIQEINLHGNPKTFSSVIFTALLNDIQWLSIITLTFIIPYVLLYILNKKISAALFVALGILLLIVQFVLIEYFSQTLVPLGADLWSYTWKDIKQTLGSAGISAMQILLIVFVTAVAIYLFKSFVSKIKLSFKASGVFICSLVIIGMLSNFSLFNFQAKGDEYAANLSYNKSAYFYKNSYRYFFPGASEDGIDLYAEDKPASVDETSAEFKYIDEANYPFLHQDETQDVLSPLFQKAHTKPNIVILLIEGLGRSFSNKEASWGSFTPFLDSLSQQGLYWPNALSTQGRTFGVLPSVLGSLPFGNNGFAELGNKAPAHFTLINLLKTNGYSTNFFYGGDASFDNMSLFLKNSKIDKINDIASFPANVSKMPAVNGFTWGYGDKALFKHYLQTIPQDTQKSYCNVVLTVSTHNPFKINEQQQYLDKFESFVAEKDKSIQSKAQPYTQQFASILYMDDAVREFMNAYSKRADFKNTIFVFTGDHRMPEIPMEDKLERYHVPLIIYSPMLKKPRIFGSLVSHFDIAPTLLSHLKNSYAIKLPSQSTWLGKGLDTVLKFSAVNAYPLMQTKNDLVDYVYKDNLLNQQQVFNITNKLTLQLNSNTALQKQLEERFTKFKRKNALLQKGALLIPDSLYTKYVK